MFWPQHLSRSDVEQPGFWFLCPNWPGLFQNYLPRFEQGFDHRNAPALLDIHPVFAKRKVNIPAIPQPCRDSGYKWLVHYTYEINQYLVYIFWPVIDNCPTRNSSRGRMALEIISWPIPMRECCLTAGSNPRTSAYQAISRGTSYPVELARSHFIKKKKKK